MTTQNDPTMPDLLSGMRPTRYVSVRAWFHLYATALDTALGAAHLPNPVIGTGGLRAREHLDDGLQMAIFWATTLVWGATWVLLIAWASGRSHISLLVALSPILGLVVLIGASLVAALTLTVAAEWVVLLLSVKQRRAARRTVRRSVP